MPPINVTIDTKVTAPYETSANLFLIPPGSIIVKMSGNDELYALRFTSDDRTGTLNGVISSKGDGAYTYGIMFNADGNLIFSAGKMAIAVNGNQNASGIWGGVIQLSAAAGPLAGAVNVTAQSAVTATAIGFEAVTEFHSKLAMTVGVIATGGVNANATGFDYEMDADAGFDDKFKLTVTAKAGSGGASARGVSDSLTVVGGLAGTVKIVADAANGSFSNAVGFANFTGITDVSDKFKLTVTAKSGSGGATAYGMSGSLGLSGVLAGAITVAADAAKGTSAFASGIDFFEGGTSVSDKFKLMVTVKAGSETATAQGMSGLSSCSGIFSGSIVIAADASKGTIADAYGFRGINAGSISDQFKLRVTVKAGASYAMAQGIYESISVSDAVSGTILVVADAAKGTEANAYGLSMISGTNISDKFKLTVTAKAGTDYAKVHGVSSTIDLSGALSGTVVATADASKGTYADAYGLAETVAGSISDRFKLTVTAKAGTDYATAHGASHRIDLSGALSGTVVATADASKGTYADAYGLAETVAGSISDRFKLTVTAKAGTDYAIAQGVDDSLTLTGVLSGTMVVVADASKGTSADAYGIAETVAGSISDKFQLTVTAKAGSVTAFAQGLSRSLTLSGILAGTVLVAADAAKGGVAIAYGIADISGITDISDQFKLTVTAKAGTGSAAAQGISSLTGNDWGLSGTIVVAADAAKGTVVQASGLTAVSGVSSVSDHFSLTVSAEAGTGDSYAEGLGVNNVTNLSGTLTVTAESVAGAAEAIGCKILSGDLFSVLQTCIVTAVAKTSSAASYGIAAGLSGDDGKIGMAGQVAVAAAGSHSIAYGVRLNQILSGSYVDGVISAVGNQAYGVCSGDSSVLVVNGGIYAGTAGNAGVIAKSLQKAVGSYKSAAMLNKNAEMAVQMGDDSTLTLTKGSVVIGDVSMGSDSTVKLSTGAQLYGGMGMSAGNVNITVDAMLDKAATVNLSSAGASVFALGSGVTITVTANAGTQTGSYVLLAGSDLSSLDGANFNTLYHLSGFDTNNLIASWRLDHGKTDTLTLIVSEKPLTSSLRLGSALDGAAPLLSASSLTDDLLAMGEGAWKHTTLA